MIDDEQKFYITRDELLTRTGWSLATLGRRAAAMRENEHFVYRKSKTKPERIFSESALDFANTKTALTNAPQSQPNTPKKDNLTERLAECGAEFYRRGWVSGTSGNFSALIERNPLQVCITASGNDKGTLKSDEHFLEIDEKERVLRGVGKPSAETSIHLAIYNLKPEAKSILHTHSVWGTILSDVYFKHGGITIENYEMLKGLNGVTTHEHTEFLPVVENSQNYVELSQTVENVLIENPSAHGIYLHHHGLYTWGSSIAEAKRHIEIFEFLFEVNGRKMMLR